MEERIAQLMKSLECTREEALQVIADDEAIDKGAKLFSLSAEQEKASKQARSVDRKPSTEKRTRERKVDSDKHELFQAIDEAMTDIADNVEVLNQDRELLVHFNDKKFKIVLSVPRK